MTIISLFVSSPDTYSERRLDTSLTVRELKVSRLRREDLVVQVFALNSSPADASDQAKLVPITGIQPQYQNLQLQRSGEDVEVLARLDNEDASLGSYSPQEYQCLKVCLPSDVVSVRYRYGTKKLT